MKAFKTEVILSDIEDIFDLAVSIVSFLSDTEKTAIDAMKTTLTTPCRLIVELEPLELDSELPAGQRTIGGNLG